jgi:hypothetical protein
MAVKQVPDISTTHAGVPGAEQGSPNVVGYSVADGVAEHEASGGIAVLPNGDTGEHMRDVNLGLFVQECVQQS